MGTDNKVFLQFPRVFWDREETLIFRVAGDSSRAALINAALWTGRPILGALLGGRYAEACEQFSDEKLAGDFMDVLRRSFSGPLPDPEPVVLRSRWSSNPSSYGSYSHIPVGASPRDYIALARPVGTSLFFAGEATVTDYPGSAHGAYTSGRREAFRILGLRGGR
jgi:monoamine oxidase